MEVETKPEQVQDYAKLLDAHNKLQEEHNKLRANYDELTQDYKRLQFFYTLLETYFVLLAWHHNHIHQFPEILDDIRHWFPDTFKKIMLMIDRKIKTSDLHPTAPEENKNGKPK